MLPDVQFDLLLQVWTDSGVNTASGCANFTFGSQSKCQTSYASVIMGTFVLYVYFHALNNSLPVRCPNNTHNSAFWLLASIISVFSLLHFRKHGSLPNKRPSISNPVFDDKSARSSINSNSNKDLEKEARSRPQTRLYRERFDVEHGSVHTETEDGTHPGRPVSIGGQELPKTAPATYTQFSVPPQWKQIFYGEVGLTNETEPAPRHLSPPLGSRRKPAPARLPTPPSINIYTTGNSYAQEIVSARRPAPFDTLRGMPRGPVPGPASQHIGGYHSAHHTPMPLGLGGKMQGSRYDQAMVSPEYKGRLKFPEADYGRI